MIDGDDSSTEVGDFEKHGHGEVEMEARWVTPATIVAGQSIVRRAEVGGRNDDGWAARVAPPGVICIRTLDLEARAAAQPVVEQCGAQRRRVHSISLAVQIAVPTSPAHGSRGIIAAIESSMSSLPLATGVDPRDSGVSHRKQHELSSNAEHTDTSHWYRERERDWEWRIRRNEESGNVWGAYLLKKGHCRNRRKWVKE
uniref:Uncharacterized protein n=1 Tax=Rhizophora mucronata TaxID=61149 RepID=A0A2P2II17_RHIMU